MSWIASGSCTVTMFMETEDEEAGHEERMVQWRRQPLGVWKAFDRVGKRWVRNENLDALTKDAAQELAKYMVGTG